MPPSVQRVFIHRNLLLVLAISVATVTALFWVAGGAAHQELPSNARPTGAPDKPPIKGALPRASNVPRPATGVVPRTLSYPAHIAPYEQTDVYGKISGYIARMLVDLGDRVEKDQPLAELSVPEIHQERRQKAAALAEAQAQRAQASAAIVAAEEMVVAAEAKLSEAKASLLRHEANVEFRRIDLARSKKMAPRAASQAEVDEKENLSRGASAARDAAQAAVATAQANLAMQRALVIQAKANLSVAEARVDVASADLGYVDVLLSYAVIRAPFAGVVVGRALHTGAFVPPASSSRHAPLLTVARVDRLRIVSDVPESDARAIQVGQPAELVVDADRVRTYRGAVARTSESLDSATRTLCVEVELTGAAPELRPGMYGTVRLALLDDAVPGPDANASRCTVLDKPRR
jgi:multidrug efflux pump subunit AcrA (membrane-fusion protein)